MALSRITTLDVLSTVTRVSRPATLEVQHAIPAASHWKHQTLHVTSARQYPDSPVLALPSNVRNIFANETGRFAPERARDIALYSENGGSATCPGKSSGFPKIRDRGHVDAYDCFGAVSLNGTMQSNVPKPFSSSGKSTHLNMPGGQWSRDGKYIAEDMQRSHYRKLCVTTNALTNMLLRVTCRPIHVTGMGYSTNASEAAKDDQLTPQKIAMMSKRDRFRLMVRDYGATLVVFHITISLMCLGACYMVVISGVDVMPFVQKITGGSQDLDNVMKTSTDFILAYTVHKLLAPVRISITMAVTPMLVRYLRRIGLLKKPKPKSPPPSS